MRLIDFMPPRQTAPDLVRIVEGVAGSVATRLDLTIRFDYGSIVPWVRRTDDGILAVAGPDALHLATPVELVGRNFHTIAEFEVRAGERVPFVLTVSRPTSSFPSPSTRSELSQRPRPTGGNGSTPALTRDASATRSCARW